MAAAQHTIKQSGFTLIEVMVAVLLLAIGYVAVLESFSTSLRRLAKDGVKRQAFFEQEVDLSRQLRFANANEAGDDGDIYLEGKIYNLHHRASESGLLKSLKLVVVQ